MSRLRSVVWGALLIGLAKLCFAGTVPAEIIEKQSLAPMLKRTQPAVVNISTRGVRRGVSPLSSDPFFQQFMGEQHFYKPTQSLGSGVVIDKDEGLILTNQHVVANAREITVTFHDGERMAARILGGDTETDLALLQTEKALPAELPLGDSDVIEVGDYVVAIGNPFGLGQSVTSGIISALDRNEVGVGNIAGFIQTDASINPGNSGGALVDLKGQLLGINTAIVGPGGGSVGIGFAVPVNLAHQVVDDLRKYGEVHRGTLGVTLRDMTPSLQSMLGIEQDQGALIWQVQIGSSADRAGLEPGDLITRINGRKIQSADGCIATLRTLRPGVEVKINFYREATEIESEITLE